MSRQKTMDKLDKIRRKKVHESPLDIRIEKTAMLESSERGPLKGMAYAFNVVPVTEEDVYNDYDIRETFATGVATSMGIGVNPRDLLIYAETPNNYLDQISVLKDEETKNSLYKEVLAAILKHDRPATAAINIRLLKHKIDQNYSIPQHIKRDYDRISIIVANNASSSNTGANGSYAWMLAHELFHTIDSQADEKQTQKNTLDYLYDLGFVDEIGLEYVGSFRREYVLGLKAWARQYSVVDLVQEKLKSNGDLSLLYAYNRVLYELLIDNGYEEEAKQVMDWINEYDGEYDSRDYEGIWF